MYKNQSLSFTIAESARSYLKNLFQTEGKDYFRIRILGGGCAGFQYDFSLVSRQEREAGDIEIDDMVLIDPYSAPYLTESALHYVNSAMGSYIEITNPQAKSSCGCKKSFSM